MNEVILLDSGPLGMASNPGQKSIACHQWLASLIKCNARVYIPEIVDYEVRRELIRAKKINGLKRLELLRSALGYLPLNTDVMLKAAEFWAYARQQGRTTADDKALDGDVILAAQAHILREDMDVIIATTNIKHLSIFVKAELWQDIK